MTYGWALLLIVLVVGALFSMGIFDMGMFTGSRATGFSQVGVSAWQMTSGGVLSLKLRNNVGKDINVTVINATYNNAFQAYGNGVLLNVGKESAATTVGTFTSAPAKGSSYSVRVDIQYTDTSSGFSYTDAGTLSGKAS